MADLTKTFNTGSSKGVSAQIVVTATTDVETNESLVSVAVSLKSTSYLGQYFLDGTINGDTNKTLATMNSGNGTHFVTIDAKNTAYAIQGSGSAKGSPWTFTAAHDNDGTKTITVSVSITGYGSGGANGFSVSGSFVVVLPQIPRASTIGATDANIGATSMIAVFRKSSAYTHSVQYKFGNLSGYVTASGGITQAEVKITETSIPFLIPAEFYAQIPSAKSALCTLTCRTYSGATQIGEPQTSSFTATAAEDLCSPQISGTVEDTNTLTISLTGNKSKLVRYVSTALCTIDATAGYSATISAKKINGQTVSGNTLTIEKMSTSPVAFSATDSRGYTKNESVEVSIVSYVPLTCVASGRRTNPTNGNAVISVKGNYFNSSFGAVANSLEVQYRIGSGSWITITPSISGNSYTASASLTGLDYTSSYAITVRATDKIGSVEQTVTIGKGIPVFDWGEKDFSFNVPVNMHADIELNGHNLLQNGAIPYAPTGYGLGWNEGKSCSDCNTATMIGWYRMAGSGCTNIPNNYLFGYGVLEVNARYGDIFQTIRYGGYVAVRHGIRDETTIDNVASWTEWEYVKTPTDNGVSKNLTAPGWYRVGRVSAYRGYRITIGTIYNSYADNAAIVDATTSYYNPVLTKTSASCSHNSTKAVDQIRLVKDGNYYYVDIHYAISYANDVYVRIDGALDEIEAYENWTANATGTAAVTLSL